MVGWMDGTAVIIELLLVSRRRSLQAKWIRVITMPQNDGFGWLLLKDGTNSSARLGSLNKSFYPFSHLKLSRTIRVRPKLAIIPLAQLDNNLAPRLPAPQILQSLGESLDAEVPLRVVHERFGFEVAGEEAEDAGPDGGDEVGVLADGCRASAERSEVRELSEARRGRKGRRAIERTEANAEKHARNKPNGEKRGTGETVRTIQPFFAPSQLTSTHRNMQNIDLLHQQNIGPDPLGVLGGATGESDEQDATVGGAALEAGFELANDVVC